MPQGPTKAHAIRIEKTGGPEQLKWVEVDLPTPGKGEVQLKNLACGLNFIDALRFMSQAELAAFLADAGFTTLTWFGNWDRSPVGATSPEFIVIAG